MCGLNLSPCDLTSASSERPQGRWVVTGRYQRVIKRYQLQPLSPCVLTIRSAPLVAGNGTAAAAGGLSRQRGAGCRARWRRQEGTAAGAAPLPVPFGRKVPVRGGQPAWRRSETPPASAPSAAGPAPQDERLWEVRPPRAKR